MKIRDIIIDKELIMAQDRLEALKEMQAPEVMITALEKEIASLETGHIEIGGETDLLDCEYKYHIVKTGRGGKKYILFNDWVRYYPKAKYGRYITK